MVGYADGKSAGFRSRPGNTNCICELPMQINQQTCREHPISPSYVVKRTSNILAPLHSLRIFRGKTIDTHSPKTQISQQKRTFMLLSVSTNICMPALLSSAFTAGFQLCLCLLHVYPPELSQTGCGEKQRDGFLDIFFCFPTSPVSGIGCCGQMKGYLPKAKRCELLCLHLH
jgi:hypothetical protein